MRTTCYNIDVDALAGIRADGTAHILLDIREPDEIAICAIQSATGITSSERIACLAGAAKPISIRTGCRSASDI